jgi:predicted enzyme involved in methoxymalonyl-ACP biosynthesis
MSQAHMLALSIRCVDRFGDYGVVGFCLFDRADIVIADMMYSCRVQAKRVEHAVLLRLMQMLKLQGAQELRARYNKTTKNIQASRVFADLGYEVVEVDEISGKHVFAFDLTQDIPKQDVVSVDWRVSA